MQNHPIPHRPGRNPLQLVVAALLAALLLAQPVLADADPAADSEAPAESSSEAAADTSAASETSDASDAAADSESASNEADAAGHESRTIEILNKTFDAVVLRPPQALMAAAGAVAFVPAAILASPGGRDSIEEALDRFVMIPVETAFQRPLGEF
jgi:hypothetical protein